MAAISEKRRKIYQGFINDLHDWLESYSQNAGMPVMKHPQHIEAFKDFMKAQEGCSEHAICVWETLNEAKKNEGHVDEKGYAEYKKIIVCILDDPKKSNSNLYLSTRERENIKNQDFNADVVNRAFGEMNKNSDFKRIVKSFYKEVKDFIKQTQQNNPSPSFLRKCRCSLF